MTVAANLRSLVLPHIRRLLASQPVSDLVARTFRNDIPSRGLRFRIDNASVGSRTASELLFRLYERHEIAFVRNQMLKRYDVVELGAGIGVTGSHVLQRLDHDRRFIAVEANQDLHPTLQANLRRHGQNRDVAIVHGAVSYSGADRVTLNQSTEHTYSRVGAVSGADQGVPALTLSGIAAEFNLDSFILISDIEGAEQDIIMRDAAALETCQQLIIELHGPQSEISEMSAELTRIGFAISARRKTIYTFTRDGA